MNSPEYRSSLAPRKLIKGQDPAYYSVEDLAYAMTLPQCRNIALTGIYGSGKSSIINTFLSTESAPENVLRISLSNFCEENIDAEDKKEYENIIEYKIFQHILYKANESTTEKSRFKKLSVWDAIKNQHVALYAITCFICFVIVFEPKFLQVDSFYEAYDFIFGQYGRIVNIVADFLASIAMIIIAYYALKRILNNIHRIVSIKAKDVEVCFKEDKDVFNQLLDEILYFFNAGEYEVIIFEDLDRIKEPQQLFLKLREINILLNESHSNLSRKKIVRFIYAIKDDVFLEEVRTKCFDYIVPVVPVVNKFNAGEYLLTHYKEILDGINVADIKRLGLFVNRMRDLTNIMNEYILYKKTIFMDSMSATKLLAMTIYKNLYPQDYSRIHEGAGLLFSVFNNKHLYSKPLTYEKNNEIIRLSESIRKAREALTNNRLIVLDYLGGKYNISKLVIKGVAYTLDEIASKDSLYNLFENDKVESCIIDDSTEVEIGSYQEKFKDLLKAADSNDTYHIENDRHMRVISDASKQKRILENEIASINSKTLRELMKLNGDGNKTKGVLKKYADETINRQEINVEELVTTLHGLIRGGYISDDYATYISYTYTGSFDEDDFKFQQSVIQGTPLAYDYKLTHIDAFIDNIFTDNYEDKSILNFDLLNYLISKKKSVQLENFIKTARQNPNFVVAYDNTQKKQEKFFRQLFYEWHSSIHEINIIDDNDVRSYMLHLFFRNISLGLNLSSEDVDFISGQYKFIADDIENCNLENLEKFWNSYNVVFKELIEPTPKTEKLLESVVRSKQFAINYNNLRVVYGPSFETSSYTSILLGDKDIRQYVTKDINFLVSLFPDTDTEECPDSMVHLAKCTNIKDEAFIGLFSRQQQKIDTLEGFNANICEAVIKANLVNPSWDIIRYAFVLLDDKDSLIQYIEQHSPILSNDRLKEEDSDLQDFLLNDNVTLSIKAYSHIAKSAHYCVDVVSNPDLAVERLSILMDNDLIQCDKETIRFISNEKASVFAKFMIRHFDDIVESNLNTSFSVTNALGIEILESSLTASQKAKFLLDFAFIENTNDSSDYARMICDFYHSSRFNVDVDVKLLVEALKMINPPNYWKIKIDLINNIHRNVDYDADRTKTMVDSLGEPYIELNTYAYQTKLDDNPENVELLQYLKDNAPYISKIKPADNNQLKVTYKQSR